MDKNKFRSSLPFFSLVLGSCVFFASPAFAITWQYATDAELQSGQPIKAIHVKEVRDKMVWDLNGVRTFYNGGNVGIGVASPNHKLDISGGNVQIRGTSAGPIADTFGGNTQQSYIHFPAVSGSNDPGYIMHETRGAENNEGVLHLAPSDDNVYGDYVSIHGTNDPDRIKLHTDGTVEGVTNFTATGTARISGSVGIGTTSPNEKLDVIGNIELTGRIDTEIPVNGVAWSFEGGEFIRKMTDRGGVRIGKDDSLVIGDGEAPDTISNNVNMLSENTYVGSDNNVYIYTDLQNGWGYRKAFTFRDNGRFGIGTTNPGQTLDVVGTTQTDYLILNPQDGSSEGGELRLDGAGSNTTWSMDNYAGRIRFYHDGSERLTIRNNGRVGIGTASPGAPLHVAGNIIASNPTASNHVATKSYVDSQGGSDNLGDHIGRRNLVFNDYGKGVVGTYSSVRYQNLFSMGTAYVPATNGTALNNMYGIAWTHSNVGGESVPGLGHQALFVAAGDTRSAIGTGVWTKYDITGNRFMDQNNTGYYLDPHSVSYLNDIRPNIIYDRQNTGYYVDPNGTTNLNNLYVQGNELGVNGEANFCGSAGCTHFAYDNGGPNNYIRGTLYHNARMYDENNTAYSLDMDNVSYFNDIRPNVIYDRQNTGYYVDPNGSTNLANLRSTGNYVMNNGSPTIYLQDSDHRSGIIHMNSNLMYFLRGSGNNSTNWATYNGMWPLYLNMTNNQAIFGGSIGVRATPGGSFHNHAAIALGDSDTGIRQDGDGQLELWTNNVERMHIRNDGATGIGVGNPTARLQVHKGVTYNGNALPDWGDRSTIGVTGTYPALVVGSSVNNWNHAGAISLWHRVNGSGNTRNWNIGAAQNGLTIGTCVNNGNPHCGLENYSAASILSLENNGNVGVGTIGPARKFHVYGPNYVRFQSPHGYVDIGPGNGSYTHFYTDRGQYYFNKRIMVDEGVIGAYNDHLYLRTGGNTRIFANKDNGRVGVGKTNPGERLDINGSAKADAFLYNSDRRLKKDIQTISGLDIIERLRGVTFTWKSDDSKSVGLIAQEVETVLPEAVRTSDQDGFKTVDYAKLVAPLIEAVKEQKAQIEAQQAQINNLTRQVSELQN